MRKLESVSPTYSRVSAPDAKNAKGFAGSKAGKDTSSLPERYREIARLISQAGVSGEWRSESGDTALTIAMRLGMQELLEAGDRQP